MAVRVKIWVGAPQEPDIWMHRIFDSGFCSRKDVKKKTHKANLFSWLGNWLHLGPLPCLQRVQTFAIRRVNERKIRPVTSQSEMEPKLNVLGGSVDLWNKTGVILNLTGREKKGSWTLPFAVLFWYYPLSKNWGQGTWVRALLCAKWLCGIKNNKHLGGIYPVDLIITWASCSSRKSR